MRSNVTAKPLLQSSGAIVTRREPLGAGAEFSGSGAARSSCFVARRCDDTSTLMEDEGWEARRSDQEAVPPPLSHAVPPLHPGVLAVIPGCANRRSLSTPAVSAVWAAARMDGSRRPTAAARAEGRCRGSAAPMGVVTDTTASDTEALRLDPRKAVAAEEATERLTDTALLQLEAEK